MEHKKWGVPLCLHLPSAAFLVGQDVTNVVAFLSITSFLLEHPHFLSQYLKIITNYALSLMCLVKESAAHGPIHIKVFNVWSRHLLRTSQNTSAVEGYPVILAVGMKRLDTFNYSSATLFHLTSKTKLAVTEDSGYTG